MTFVCDAKNPQLQYFTADNISGEAVAVFATRNGGVSGATQGSEHLKSLNLQYDAPCDSNDNVSENYKIIASSFGFSPDRVFSIHQVHADDAIIIDETFISEHPQGSADEKADALITDVKGILLSVRTADCVPILLYDTAGKVVAAVHSGWRGTFLKNAVKALERMVKIYGTVPDDIKCAIGPAIGRCCYEVDHDIYWQFLSEHGGAIDKFIDTGEEAQKPHIDLRAMNMYFLIQAGVPECNFDISSLCTRCNPGLFYSHRRSGFKRGAMASFIGMRH